MSIFLGIDGGGSKTSCLIGDEHSVLGGGIAAGSNLVRLGEVRVREALAGAIQQACAEAKIKPAQIDRTCIGVAGATGPGVSEIVRRIIAEIVAGEIEVVGDMVIALEAAFSSAPGVIVIAGTGSIAYGRNSQGEMARAGGWGFAVSDEGSGHWIGRAAVSAALRDRDSDEDKGEGQQLLQSVMKSWHLETHEELVRTANAMPPPDFAALFPAVLTRAESGDALALGVLTQAGHELAGLTSIVIRRIFRESKTVPVAMSGGVFGNSALVREVFYNSLQSEHAQVSISESVVEPVRGALELARRGAR